jgi:transposase
MSTKSNSISFKNQTFDIGIDVHKKNWKVTIRTNSMHLKTFSLNPAPAELYHYMKKNYPEGTYRSVYESGFCGYWIHRELSTLGFKNIITNAADVPTSHKEKDRKCDSIDSAKLSRELENKSLTGIYILTPYQESLRSLSRLLRQYSKRNTQVKTRIKSFLDYLGIKMPETLSLSNWSRNYLTWLSELKFAEVANRFVLDEHVEELDHIRRKRLKFLKQIRDISSTIPIISFLRTVPGLGQITAFALYTELIDIKRFRNFATLASYIGLVPSTASSDEKTIVNGMTLRHNRNLRYILIEAAWVAARVDPAMTAAFCNLTRRMKKSRAIVQIAKKLLNRIRYVWLHQKEYVPAVVE